MAKLNAKNPADGLLPLTEGEMTLTEVEAREIWSIAPYPGASVGIPSPNRSTGKEGQKRWAEAPMGWRPSMYCGLRKALLPIRK